MTSSTQSEAEERLRQAAAEIEKLRSCKPAADHLTTSDLEMASQRSAVNQDVMVAESHVESFSQVSSSKNNVLEMLQRQLIQLKDGDVTKLSEMKPFHNLKRQEQLVKVSFFIQRTNKLSIQKIRALN